MSDTGVFDLTSIIARTIGEGTNLGERLDRIIRDRFRIRNGEPTCFDDTFANVELTLRTLNYIVPWSYDLEQNSLSSRAQAIINMVSLIEQAFSSIHALLNEMLQTMDSCSNTHGPSSAHVVQTWTIQKFKLNDIGGFLMSVRR